MCECPTKVTVQADCSYGYTVMENFGVKGMSHQREVKVELEPVTVELPWPATDDQIDGAVAQACRVQVDDKKESIAVQRAQIKADRKADIMTPHEAHKKLMALTASGYPAYPIVGRKSIVSAE